LELSAATAFGQQKNNLVVPNENLIAQGIPDISKDLSNAVKKYAEARGAGLSAIHPSGNEIIINTRFGSTAQLHRVVMPMGMREQLTFFDEPVAGATFEPTKGEYLIYSRDAGGNEFGQLYRLDLKTLESKLLTDGGRSQNGGIEWRRDGKGFFFTSTKRNGGDRDIYYMDPNDPNSVKLILEVKGGGWSIEDLSLDNRTLLIGESISANESHLWALDIAAESCLKSPIAHLKASSRKVPTSLIIPMKSGTSQTRTMNLSVWPLLTLKTKKLPITLQIPWNVERYRLSDDKKQLVFTTNEAGLNKMYLMNTVDKTYAEIKNLPVGLIGGAAFTKDGKYVFFTQSRRLRRMCTDWKSPRDKSCPGPKANSGKSRNRISRCQNPSSGKVSTV
jgi:Tol biopolymer transport system component